MLKIVFARGKSVPVVYDNIDKAHLACLEFFVILFLLVLRSHRTVQIQSSRTDYAVEVLEE